MDLTQLANLGEFIGGVAVLVTLIYLAVQVRSNTKSERAETHRSFVQELNRAFVAPMQDLEKATLFRRGAASFRGLSGDEQMVVSAFWASVFMIGQEGHFLHLAGSIDDELAETIDSFAVAMLQAPGVAEWWEEAGRAYIPSFQSHVAKLRASDHETPAVTELWSWFSASLPNDGDR